MSISSILIKSVWVVLSIATYLLRTYNNAHFEMPCLATMLAWKKYELYNYVMRLAYILIWSPYIYLVSLNTNKRVQHCTLNSTAIMPYYFLSQRYERNYVLFKNVEKDFNHASLDAIQTAHHNPWIEWSFGNEVQHTSRHCSSFCTTLILWLRVSRIT